MRVSMVICPLNPARPMVDLSGGSRLDMDLLMNPRRHRENKVVVVLGPTGTGKSRLSIDIASRFPAEIVNSDKLQVYRGLDVVTNKISDDEKFGVPHHLMGFAYLDNDFSVSDFCDAAGLAIGSIGARGQVPVVVGGSNSYVEALVDKYSGRYNNNSNFRFCFLWVDVATPVLHRFVSGRVDRMVQHGLVDEVRAVFDPEADYSKGVRRAIGVPELDRYFRAEKHLTGPGRARVLAEAIDEIKKNTCQLACRQLAKIHRLRDGKGWNFHRLDATEVFRKLGGGGNEEEEEAWEESVAGPAATIVSEFLYGNGGLVGGGGFVYEPLSGIRFSSGIETVTASVL